MKSFNFDHSAFPMFVGFDKMFDEMERISSTVKQVAYPPYNIKKVGTDKYTIEIAAAGFSKTDIDLELSGNELKVTGEIKPDDSTEFLHKGIAERGFERKFKLADSVVVKNAEMVNGMLRIFLETYIPLERLCC
jgi:molecular chaperone IbpA